MAFSFGLRLGPGRVYQGIRNKSLNFGMGLNMAFNKTENNALIKVNSHFVFHRGKKAVPRLVIKPAGSDVSRKYKP